MDKTKRTILGLLVLSSLLLIVGGTYAFIEFTLTGEKKQTIVAGTLSLELFEDNNNISITDALPMYDEVGMIQEPFTFRLVNQGTASANYTLKLEKIGIGTLSENDVKLGLTKNGVETIKILSYIDEVLDSGTIEGNNTTINYELRLWIRDGVTDNSAISGKSLSYKLNVEVGQAEETITKNFTLAGIAKQAQSTTSTMFNYSSEGCFKENWDSSIPTCLVAPTNGIYFMDDDDGTSYFYRGEADNLVQFGAYQQDYYVYRYTDDSYGNITYYDYTTLEACKYDRGDDTTCVRTKKYDAGTPMYWKIIRVNGDGTIRMIYSGTTKEAKAQETGIGLSRYDDGANDPKYAGYTYDRTTSEVKSTAKTEVDNWYTSYLANTEYDKYIADGKFCSDTSDYGEVTLIGYTTETSNFFGSQKRTWARVLGLGNANPTFKCAPTTYTYGGSYTLKAGLITLDEIVAAGGQGLSSKNKTYYLHNGTKGQNDGYFYWSMTPEEFIGRWASVSYVPPTDRMVGTSMAAGDGLLRPVINLRADVIFQPGTDGSIATPYQIVEQ